MVIQTHKDLNSLSDGQPKTIQEVAAWFRVSEHKIREWMARTQDPIPFVKPSHKLLRFDMKKVEAWWERQNEHKAANDA